MNFMHNLSFYIDIIKGLDLSLNYGVFPAYINAYTLDGALSFENLAVPHLHLYIPTIIYNITENINFSINMYFIIIDILMLINMYILFSTITKKKWRSLVASLFYVSIHVIITNLLVSSDLSVSFAIAMLPLYIASLYNIFKGNSKLSILFVFSLFMIGESSIAMFLFAICISLIYAVFHIADSIFKLKIFHILLLIAITILLLAYTYVPIIDYFFNKQLDIVSTIGNNLTLIKIGIYTLINIIYIWIALSFINKMNSKGFHIISTIFILLFTVVSICSYIYIYKYTERLIIKDDVYTDKAYLVRPDNDIDDTIDRDKYGYGPMDMEVESLDTGYIQMDIHYATSDEYDTYILDTPYSYVKGLKASDENGDLLKTAMKKDGIMRVYIPKGEGIVHISYKNPILYDIALIVSIITLLTYLGFKSILEIRSLKKKTIDDKASIDILTNN